ncbi:MAG: hypothetical protein ACFCBU_14040 [Cyanophyceae cyanobacterium]
MPFLVLWRSPAQKSDRPTIEALGIIRHTTAPSLCHYLSISD